MLHGLIVKHARDVISLIPTRIKPNWSKTFKRKHRKHLAFKNKRTAWFARMSRSSTMYKVRHTCISHNILINVLNMHAMVVTGLTSVSTICFDVFHLFTDLSCWLYKMYFSLPKTEINNTFMVALQ